MNNSKKYLFLIVMILLVVIGVSLAYFGIKIIGNDTAKGNKVVTGNLELTFTDTNEISLENAFPGDSFTKTILVKNTGTKEVSYNLVWTELTNEITNNELVIESTCKRLNSSGTEEETCESISETPISNNIIKKNISIEVGTTHEYSIKVTFLDMDEPQDYNKNKSFTGKLGINEYELPTSVSFAEDSWETISELVKAGKTDTYNVGDTKIVDLGTTYGTHTLRIANMSTPEECSAEDFSQSACGFVVEFKYTIVNIGMNNTATNVGGWPASITCSYVNNALYNLLPTDLKNIIVDTKVVSSHGSDDTENFTSTDKLYLLAPGEIYSDWKTSSEALYDTSKDLTRTLDYYAAQGITTNNLSKALKTEKTESSATSMWLRSASSYNNSMFYNVPLSSTEDVMTAANITYSFSPAFRIG